MQILRVKLIKFHITRRNKFIKLFKNELSKHSWWYSDGSQPISNGDVGLVLDENNKKHIECVIVSCGNCGDYSFIQGKQLRHEFRKEKK